ncbi:T/G mismatch-specific endonuclease [Maribacter caenipelagi]|uniref:Very short patch repair endonuclease n=1 Tax=Maribacter caenipelagi TaxID=1447781 RepID=A0A4R7DBG1_9FLAO|nr:very short patch repair endonuclease [Maribacter caenipelagi]TDS18719.1 T/G mismatch-specific endonuclease [Maribacter caenipelagi]|tara:strand:+ start:562 stop:1044 length:483 start_codon:yes stop_codon:yes gene_type:complete
MSKDYTIERIKVPRFNEASGFYTTPKRSKIMSKIKGKNTKPELAFRKALYAAGYRYRIDYKKLIGKPDIALPKYKTVIFIDGEYWHGKNWEERKPKVKTNREFWIAKIERNMQRDLEVNQELTSLGYTIFRFWETEVKKNLNECIEKTIEHLNTVQMSAK